MITITRNLARHLRSVIRRALQVTPSCQPAIVLDAGQDGLRVRARNHQAACSGRRLSRKETTDEARGHRSRSSGLLARRDDPINASGDAFQYSECGTGRRTRSGYGREAAGAGCTTAARRGAERGALNTERRLRRGSHDAETWNGAARHDALSGGYGIECRIGHAQCGAGRRIDIARYIDLCVVPRATGLRGTLVLKLLLEHRFREIGRAGIREGRQREGSDAERTSDRDESSMVDALMAHGARPRKAHRSRHSTMRRGRRQSRIGISQRG